MTSTAALPDAIRRYFELASSPDREAYFALFADDAVVEDEGRTHTGIAAIRAWRDEVTPVTYEITDVAPAGAGFVVTCTIAGDFPGSPFAGLRFHFEELDADQERVRVLRIRP